MTLPKIERASYLPIALHWRKLRPIYRSDEARCIRLPNMVAFRKQRADEDKFKPNWDHVGLPKDFDSCDWRCDQGRGHWLVDLNLFVATQAFPAIPRIVSLRRHSTPWNGDRENPVVFDLDFLALSFSAEEALRLAFTRGWELKPGRRVAEPAASVCHHAGEGARSAGQRRATGFWTSGKGKETHTEESPPGGSRCRREPVRNGGAAMTFQAAE